MPDVNDGGDPTGGGDGGGGGGGFDYAGLFGDIGNFYAGVWGNQNANQLQTILNNAYSFNASRPGYVKMLDDFMDNPQKYISATPGYQTGLNDAEQATQRTGAASGELGGGAMNEAIATTATNYNQNIYNNLYSQYSNLAGVNEDPANMFQNQQSQGQQQQNSWGQILGAVGGLAKDYFSSSSGG